MNMKTDKKHKEQQVILQELESIKVLLDEDSISDDIPILQEMVSDEATTHDKQENDKIDNHQTATKGVLPGQQSLFDEKKTKQAPPQKQSSTDVNHTKTNENPFLPKHIRERLNGTVDIPAYKQSNNDHLRKSQPKTKHQRVSKPSPNAQSKHTDQLIDSLIKEFMPQIEARLRKQLKEKIEKEN